MTPLSPADCDRVVRMVWETATGTHLGDAGPGEAPAPAGSWLASSVPIHGRWEGRVTVSCAVSLARRAASALFADDASTIDIDQASDALGELANMIAGNLKALMPGECRLGLPVTRLLEPDEARRAPAPEPAARRRFRVGPEELLVSIDGLSAWEGA